MAKVSIARFAFRLPGSGGDELIDVVHPEHFRRRGRQGAVFTMPCKVQCEGQVESPKVITICIFAEWDHVCFMDHS